MLETGNWEPILVAFCDMHGLQRDYSLIPATTRDCRVISKAIKVIYWIKNCIFNADFTSDVFFILKGHNFGFCSWNFHVKIFSNKVQIIH
jgi:hypothetical protein